MLGNRYNMVRPLKSGNNGVVYLSYDTQDRRSLAIKMIPIRHHVRPLAKVNRMVFNEINNLVKLRGNAHIAQLLDVIKDEDNVYLVQEYCGSYTVEDIITGVSNEVLPVPLKTTHDILGDLARGLQECHRNGIVHGDVKPDNIIYVESKDKYNLIDFGSSRQLDPNTKTCLIESTTYLYAAPEVMMKCEPVDESYDIWSFGKVCSEISKVTDHGQTDPILQEIVRTTLVNNPKQRPSADKLIQLLLSRY